ncbi:hypothetical protein UFOVP1324_49 [uncultured Caudovirales phage]|uniref:Uncharacterized protein n=1 Tax=uncultured Caudovirales phage TaxID=2100421 RepID=A0A6J5RRZ2_9CAUD|nr:hypothetical protein UFOVP1324_49 [uncultured Caudovirales phage]
MNLYLDYSEVGVMEVLRARQSLPNLYTELLAKKEAALAGYIVYVALCTGNGPTMDDMRRLFGEWVWRKPEIVREPHGGWVLKA